MQHATIKRESFGWVRLLPMAALILLVGIAPVGSALFNALYHDFYGERSFAGLDNFRYILQDRGFFLSLRITVLWALANTILGLFGGFVFAVRLFPSGRFPRLFYGVLLIPWGIPIYIAVPLWRALLHGNGGEGILTLLFGLRLNLLTDPAAGFSAGLVVSLWLTVPLTAFVLLGAMKKIPRSILEAARLDGAAEAQLAVFFYLPQIRETLLVMGVLNFIKAFKEFTVIFLLTSGGPPLVAGITERHIIGATTTLEIFLFDMFNSSHDFGIPAAFAVVMIFIVLVVLFIWLILRKRGGSRVGIVLLSCIIQPLLGGPLGLVWAGGYLLSLKWRRLFFWTFLAQATGEILRMSFRGFLNGFNPGIVFPLFLLFPLIQGELKPRKPRLARLGRFADPLWRAVTLFLSVLMILSCAVLLYLVLWMSLSRVSAVYVDTLLPRFLSFSSFVRIFIDEGILRYFLNTLLVAAATAAIIPLVSFPAATYLARSRPSFSSGVLTFVQVMGIVGGMHSLIPLYAIFRTLGLIDSYVPLVLVYLTHSLAFSLFTMRSYLISIPNSFWENARIEGMRPVSFMVRILFPLSLPVVTTAVMVAFLNAWNGFLVPLLFLNDDSRYTISIKLYSLIGAIASGNPKWNLFAAASIVNVALLSIIFWRFRRPLQHTALVEHEE
jgi:multiple sugar transport system permease protein